MHKGKPQIVVESADELLFLIDEEVSISGPPALGNY